MAKIHSKVRFKIEQIARLRIAGVVNDGRIAEMVGLTRSGLSRILALKEYQELESALMQGQITKFDEALAGRTEQMKEAFKVAVPVAMRTLLETVTQRRDLRAAMAAAKEILDRDPQRTFAAKANGVNSGEGEFVPASLPKSIMEATIKEANDVAKGIQDVIPATDRVQ